MTISIDLEIAVKNEEGTNLQRLFRIWGGKRKYL